MLEGSAENVLYLTAGTVALAALVVPFLGWFLLNRLGGLNLAQRSVRPHIPLAIFAGAGILVLSGICIWTKTPRDWVMLIVLACSFAFGIVRPQAVCVAKRFRIVAQLLVAMLPLLAGEVLPVSEAFPVINYACTALLVIGLLNVLEIINFIDGLSSLAIFITAACAAAVLNLATQDFHFGDPSGVVFALALCGGSLGFVLFRRPPSRREASDPAAMLLGVALCIVLIRTWKTAGSDDINPGVFLPLVLVIPVLLAGIHRDRMSLFRRQRLALILIAIGQLPSWVPVVLGTRNYLGVAVLSVGSIILWTALITQGRALRGWSMRVIAEPIADVLRMAFILLVLNAFFGILLALELHWIVLSVLLTTGLLVAQVTWWRRRLERVNRSEVVIFASQDDYEQAQEILRNCADLFGGHRARRARIGLRSKHLRDEVIERLTHGDTVLILGESVRKEVLGLRTLGDLILAKDCMLLCHPDHEQAPEPSPNLVAEILQQTVHRLLALMGMVLFAPAFVVIALLIKFHDGGPVYFRQERLGQNGKPFTLYKFRSMRVNAPVYEISPRQENDARITRIGRFLRRTSLDELPQLINVALGQMRLVGPRPEMPFICAKYNERERKRLKVPPGVTGLWQVSAHRNDPIHDHVEYDLAYRHARGPFLDAAIIIATLFGNARHGL